MIKILSPCTKLLIIGLLFSTGALRAQVSYTATYHNQAGNPGGLNLDADQATDGWTTILAAEISQNQWSHDVSIPFAFAYFGRSVETFKVSGNGLLSFLNNPLLPTGENEVLPSSSLPDSTIACFWEKFTTMAPTGSNDLVQTKLFGQAPNRQFWIRWTSYEWGSSNFQFVSIVLEENTHNIYLVDMYGNQFGDPVSTTAGLQASNAFAVKYGDDQLPLNGISPSYFDNSYYKFETYDIEPYDMNVMQILSPKSEGCGNDKESIRVKISNIGLLPATGIQASFSVDGGPFSIQETLPGELAPGAEMDFTFKQEADLSAFGAHSLTVLVQVAGDGNSSNDSLHTQVHSTLNVSSFPYEENFEEGAGGWTVGGENSSWDLAYPNATIIQGAASGVKAWVTNPDGVYNNSEKSYVSSPCFDLSQADADLHISMKVWWDTEHSWDGAVLQATKDGGENWINVGSMGSEQNWFNDNTIGALPGDSPIGWTGNANEGTSPGAWVQVQHPLGPALIGEPIVRFRLAFGSDNAGSGEGFAFDDVLLAVPPQVELGNGGFFCEGTTLHVASQGLDILWSTGSDKSEIVLTNPGSSFIVDSLITVQLTNNKGLIGKDSILVSMTDPLKFAYAQVDDIACANAETGFVGVEITGGSQPLSYTWSNGSSGPSLNEVAEGTYEVVVADLNGCSIDSTFHIESLNPLVELDFTVAHASCTGDPIGSINLNASGGVGGYSYAWSTGETGSFREGLEAGEYVITTTDQLSCARVDTILVEQAGDLEIGILELQHPSCDGDENGSIQLTLAGGSGVYEIFWDNGDTTQNIDALGTGTYTGYVLDTDGCNKLIPEIELEAENPSVIADFEFDIVGANIGFEDLSQHATTYLWDFGDGTAKSTEANPAHFYLNNGNYTVTLIASNTCGSDTLIQTVALQTVGIKDKFAESIQVYPNPFQNQIHIAFGSPSSQAYQVDLLNMHGQVVSSYTGARGVRKQQLELDQDLPTGIYFLKIFGTKGQSLIRISKDY